MKITDGEGQLTRPDRDRHQSILMFQITLILYRIMFNALQIGGRDLDWMVRVGSSGPMVTDMKAT
jgi:hypothetical protein